MGSLPNPSPPAYLPCERALTPQIHTSKTKGASPGEHVFTANFCCDVGSRVSGQSKDLCCAMPGPRGTRGPVSELSSSRQRCKRGVPGRRNELPVAGAEQTEPGQSLVRHLHLIMGPLVPARCCFLPRLGRLYSKKRWAIRSPSRMWNMMVFKGIP